MSFTSGIPDLTGFKVIDTHVVNTHVESNRITYTWSNGECTYRHTIQHSCLGTQECWTRTDNNRVWDPFYKRWDIPF